MNKTILFSDTINFVNSLKFRIPINASIIDLKIRNIRFFSKILTKGKIAIYGNYQLLILYSLYLPNNNFRNVSICKKVNFYKVINLKNFLDYKELSKIKAEVKLIKPPKCLYSIHNCKKTKCFFNHTNFCHLYMLSPLSISLLKKVSTELVLSNKKDKILNKTSSYIKSNKKIRYVNATTILGNGTAEFFINKNIDIIETSDPLWKVDNIYVDVSTKKITLIGQKLLVTGDVIVNINYESLTESLDNTSSGNLNFLQTFIPFSSEIKIKTHDNSELKESDEFKVITAKCLGEKHSLNDSTISSSGEILYNTINEQLIIQIKVIVTRKEKIFI